MYDIGIIGGGASSVVLLANIAERRADFPERPLSIAIFDKKGAFGKGIAYSTCNKNHLLNVRAAGMSALANDMAHFARFAAERGYTPHDFVPRMDYADYLAEIVQNTRQALASHGDTITLITDDITQIDDKTLTGKKGRYDCDHAIIATGNNIPYAPAHIPDAHPLYYPEPWLLDEHRPEPNADVVIIGMGLSMIDAAIALKSHGHTGKITAISRNALTPRPHSDTSETIDPFTADDIKGLPPSRLMRLIRTRALHAKSWRAAIDALRPQTNAAWQAFSTAHRSTFKRHANTLWNVHRHRMAPDIAAQIASMQESGQLQIARDGIRSVNATPDGKLAVTGKKSTYQADAVINAMGYGYDNRMGQNSDTLRIGPARFGDMFETTAMPEIRAQGAQTAAALALRMR